MKRKVTLFITAVVLAVCGILLSAAFMPKTAMAAAVTGHVQYKHTADATVKPSVTDGTKTYYFKQSSDGDGHYYLHWSTTKNFTPSKDNRVIGNILSTDKDPELLAATNIYSRTGYYIDHETAYVITKNSDDYKYFSDKAGSSHRPTTIRLNNGTQIKEEKTFNIYPHWIAKKVTVKFNGNGATTNTFADQTFTYGVSGQKFGTTTTTIARTGYKFLGWSTSSTATSASYSQNYAVNDSWINTNAGNSTGKVTLYAVWSPNIYTATLDKTGGQEGTTGPIYEKYNTGWYSDSTAATAISKVTTPIKANYIFNGYYTKATDGTKVINENGTFASNTALAADATIYSQWVPKTYTITLDKDGGTGGTDGPVYEKYDTGWFSDSTAQTSLEKVTVPSKTGYKFEGYYNGATQIIKADGSFVSNTVVGDETESSDLTVKAKWTPNVYTVTLDKNGGAGGTAGPVYEKYNTGWYSDAGASTSITSITAPSKEGYDFGGYYYGATKVINANGTFVSNTAVSENITVKAAWSAKPYQMSASADLHSILTVTKNGTTIVNGIKNTSHTTEVKHDDKLIIYITADEGYNARLKVNGTVVDSPYEVTVSGALTISATSELKTYSLTLSQGTGTSINVIRDGEFLKNGSVLKHFDKLDITCTLDNGYKDLVVNGHETKSPCAYTVTVGEDVKVSTSATPMTYTLTTSEGAGTTITVKKGDTELQDGDPITHSDVLHVTCALKEGYKDLKVNGTAVSSPYTYDVPVVGDVNIATTASSKTYTLTLSPGVGTTISVKRGTETLNNGDAISQNDTLNITCGLKNGYKNLTVNGTEQASPYSYIVNVKGNVSVVTSATTDAYTLTMAPGTGTTITVKRDDAALQNGDILSINDTLVVTCALKEGYTDLFVNGAKQSSPYSYNVSVSGNVNVTTAATAKTYNLDAYSDANATLTVKKGSSELVTVKNLAKTVTVTHYDSLTVSVSPDQGYDAVLKVNNVAVTSPYTFTVSGPVDITVTTTSNTQPEDLDQVKQNAVDEINALMPTGLSSADAEAIQLIILAAITNAQNASDAETIKTIIANARTEINTMVQEIKAAEQKAAKQKAAAQKIATQKKAAQKYKVTKLKVTSKKGKTTITWKKNKKASGYQVQYKLKTAKKFKTLKSLKGAKVVSKKLKRGKKYVIQVRPYTLISGKKVYGKWVKVARTIK